MTETILTKALLSWALVALLAALPTMGAAEEGAGPAGDGVLPASNIAGKKLLRVAQEMVYHTSAQDVPARVGSWQETGYDGVCFTLYLSPARNEEGELNQDQNMIFRWWDVHPFSYEDFLPEIEALKSVPDWGRLTDNLLWTAALVHKGVKPPDWFNDQDWEIVLANTRLAARIAREVGFRGILLDTEQYGTDAYGVWRRPFDYPLYVRSDYQIADEPEPRPFAEVAAKVRERGRQYAQALSSEYPDLVLFVIAGLYETVWPDVLTRSGGKLEEHPYGLYPAFVDGLVEGLGEAALLVSGNEATYLDSQYNEMLVHRHAATDQAVHLLSGVPELARRRISFAAGIWTDAGYGATGRFSNTDPRVNQRDPERHKHAVHNALAVSDHYAWQWGEWGGDGSSNFLTTEPTPLMREYWQANVEARQPLDLGWEPIPYEDYTDYTEAEAARQAAARWVEWEQEGFVAAAELPEFWKFRFDPEMKVRYSPWASPDYDDRSWFAIKSTLCWQSQGTRANGPGVYRVRFEVPADLDPEQQEIMLAFGGLGSGPGHVYLNGGWIAWLGDLVDAGSQIKPGETNQVTLVCLNREGPGGLMGPVRLLVRDRE